MWVFILSLVVLVFCWIWGDQEFRTKLIFTLLFLASFGILFIPTPGAGWLFIGAQAILVMVVGGSTFGAEWLTRRF